MHGRIKVRQTEEQKKIEKAEKAKKLAEFANLEVETLTKFDENNSEFLTSSRQLLEANPNCFVFWNKRRLYYLKNCMVKIPADSLINEELRLTRNCLMKDPKSYGAWFHRQWVLETFESGNLSSELALCNEFLSLDERNFHCWDYRRNLVEKMSLPREEDIKFTSDLLDKNFSNFSAWHYRSELLTPSCKQVSLSLKDSNSEIDVNPDELDIIHNAIFTDAIDQSAWFAYWRLFIAKDRSIYLSLITHDISMNLLLLKFSSPVIFDQIKAIDYHLNEIPVKLDWQPADPSGASSIWFTSLQPDKSHFKFTIIHCQEVLNFEFTSNKRQFTLNQEQLMLKTMLSISPRVDKKLVQDELNLILELFDMEPRNKWVLLTLVNMFDQLKPDGYMTRISEFLNTLQEIDPQKSAFYKTLQSELIINQAITEHGMKEFNELDFSLTNMPNLTQLSNLDNLYWLHSLDLSGNNLISLPDCLGHLVCVKELKLSRNKLRQLGVLPRMHNLQSLWLDNNLIDRLSSDFAKNIPSLKTVNLQANPLVEELTLEITSKLTCEIIIR